MATEEPAPIQSLETLILPAPPSCILNTDVGYIIGTYTLHASDAADKTNASASGGDALRTGSLLVVRPQGPDGASDFKVVASYETDSAVFDIASWDFQKGKLSLIVVGNSTGGIEVWGPGRRSSSSDTDPSAPILYRDRVIQAFPRDVMILKLCSDVDKSDPDFYAVSLSDGTIAVIDVAADTPVVWARQLHSLEPWEVVWFPCPAEKGSLSRELLLSGGDDSVVQLSEWNHEAKGEPPLDDVAVASDRRTHSAGVTALTPLWYALDEPGSAEDEMRKMVISGSYDDHIRLLQYGAGSRWRCLAELNLGGGVWRIQPLPWGKKRGAKVAESSSEDEHLPPEFADSPTEVADGPINLYLLVSCMYAGARIVRLQRDDAGAWSFDIVAKFTEHESMNYASIPCCRQMKTQEGAQMPGDDVLKGQMFVSTSFYDKRFCVWKV